MGSHTFPGRTRPKKEDWLKKKEDPEERVSSRPGPLSLHEVRLSSVLGTASSLTLTLTDTSTTPDDIQTTPAAAKQLIGHEGQRTLLRPSGGFPPGVARFPPTTNPFSIQTTKDFAFRSFSLSNKNFHSF